MREPKVYLKIIVNFLIFVGTILFIFLVIPKLLTLFLPFVIGWIVSAIAYPLVRILERKVKILPKHSSAIIIVVVVGGIVAILSLLLVFIAKETMILINDFPEILEEFTIQFDDALVEIKELSQKLPSGAQNVINNLLAEINQSLIDLTERKFELPSIAEAGAYARNVADVFLAIIITILSAYFFIAERDNIYEKIDKSIPNAVKNGWKLISDNFKVAVGGYFKAQFKIMLLLVVVMFAGFEIMRVDYSFLLALGIAFLDFLPVFGTGAILWPWAIFSMLTGRYFTAIGLVIIYLICQVLKQILQPKMVGDSIGLNPLATLVFMYIGYISYGVIGMIFGIPVGMILVNLYRVGIFNRLMKGMKIIIQDISEFIKF